jgi:hypothetical protein
MALENFKHLSLIFGYLLENHVRKSDDFSLNLVEFRLLRISIFFLILALLKFMTRLFFRYSFSVKERSVCGGEQKS